MKLKPKDKNTELTDNEHISRRDFLSVSGLAGFGFLLQGLSIPSTSLAGTSSVALSGTGSNFYSAIPVANPDLWFDGSSLGTIGSQITSWQNKGTLGTNFDLLYNASILKGDGATTASSVTVQSTSGFKAAYFNGTGWPTLHFRGVIADETNAAAYYYLDGDGTSNATVKDRTIFWVYYTTTSTSSGFSALGGYTRYTGQSGVGFHYNNQYMVLERNDAFPTNSSTGLFPPTTNSIAQAGHRQATSNSIGFWSNRSTAINTAYTYSDNTSAAAGGASTGLDGTVKLSGVGTVRVGYPNNGYTLEIIVYGRALSDSEVNTVRTFLGTKYGGSANT